MPGPPPTPTNLKLLRGVPGHRPIRPEPMPPLTATCPQPPSFLDVYAIEEWQRTAPTLFNLGLLTKVDIMTFAAFCTAYSHWRTAEEMLAAAALADPETHGLLVARDNGLIANPLTGIARRAAEAMLRIAGEFGMTPAARTRIAANPPKPPGKFDGLIA
jgi:P27 family predicted phage terminase small subunit